MVTYNKAFLPTLKADFLFFTLGYGAAKQQRYANKKMSLVFLQSTLGEIEEKLSSPDTYKLIRIAGLIRQLLFDQHSVLPIAQKEFGGKITFSVNAYTIEKMIENDIKIIGRPPTEAVAGHLDFMSDQIELTSDKYGKLKVLYVNGKFFSIKDIIKYVANKRGGIHLDEKNLDSEQQILDSLSRRLHMQGVESVFTQIFYIAKNIIKSAKKSGIYCA